MRIVLLGFGVMGRMVDAAASGAGHEVVLRADADAPPLGSIGANDSAPGRVEADVAIEFAGPLGAPARIREAVEIGIPVVSGSTGWNEELPAIRKFVREHGGALLHAPNLSIGVAVFERIVRQAARLLDVVPEYRIELDETHHTRKVDHPSGTARWLADGVVARVRRLDGWEGERVEGPDDRGHVLPDSVLPVRSYRTGDVAGTHIVRAIGPDDIIALEHRAQRRDGFARGAVRAAEWLCGRRGVYTLDDMLDELLDPPDSTPR